MSTLTPAPSGGPRLDQCAGALAADVDAVHSWYVSLADALVERTATPPPHSATDVVRCVRQALATGGDSIVGPAVSLLWASQHVGNLQELGAHLTQPAVEFSGKARP